MILLEHFNKFMNLFPEAELQGTVLPQLLLGIKDTNDHLVSMTLRCLADLVPILGASVVIGKNRNRIFSDGRPQKMSPTDNATLLRHWTEPRSITPLIVDSPQTNHMELCQQSFVSNENLLPERLSPDGGEDSVNSDKDEEDMWSDWDNDNSQTENKSSSNVDVIIPVEIKSTAETVAGVPEMKAISDDICDLDIKLQKRPSKEEEIDFFKDMEPVIAKPKLILLEKKEDEEDEQSEKLSDNSATVVSSSNNRLTVRLEEDVTEEGWGDSISDFE